MLVGHLLRSPYAHARIRSIDASAAQALLGVKAVVTSADFNTASDAFNQDVLDNCMARGKALYHGHTVAAVAANSRAVARRALKLIKVEYEILPHVTEISAAMAADAPVIQDGRGAQDAPEGSSANVTDVWPLGMAIWMPGSPRRTRSLSARSGTARNPSGLYRAARLSGDNGAGRQS